MVRHLLVLLYCLALATPAWAGFDEGVAAYDSGHGVSKMRQLIFALAFGMVFFGWASGAQAQRQNFVVSIDEAGTSVTGSTQVRLTDNGGAFTNKLFEAADGLDQAMLDIALSAIDLGFDVRVRTDLSEPNPPLLRFMFMVVPGSDPADVLACGGIAGIQCDADEVCDLKDETCSIPDLQGVCVPRPEACTAEFLPVCGCDGVTYSNDCVRQMNSATLAHAGVCP